MNAILQSRIEAFLNEMSFYSFYDDEPFSEDDMKLCRNIIDNVKQVLDGQGYETYLTDPFIMAIRESGGYTSKG